MSLSQNGKICTEGLTPSKSQPHHHHRHQWITWLIHIHIHHCTSTDNKGCFCPAGQNATKVCGEAEKSANKVANHSPWRSLLWDQTAATEAHRVNWIQMKQESICDCLTTSILTHMEHNLLKELLQNWRVKQSCGRIYVPNSFCQDIFFLRCKLRGRSRGRGVTWALQCGRLLMMHSLRKWRAVWQQASLHFSVCRADAGRSSALGFGFAALTDVNLFHWQRVSTWSRWIARVFSTF